MYQKERLEVEAFVAKSVPKLEAARDVYEAKVRDMRLQQEALRLDLFFVKLSAAAKQAGLLDAETSVEDMIVQGKILLAVLEANGVDARPYESERL